jgi:hypothetical protein
LAVRLSPLVPAVARTMPGSVLRPGSSGGADVRLPLAVGAMVTVVAAVAFDVLAGEHPTHTLGLGLVALVVAAVRVRLAGRREGVLSVISGAVVAQPALHATAKLDGHAVVSAPDGLLQVVAADGPGTAMQILVSAAVVIAVATSGRVAQLIFSALHRPVQLLVSGPEPAVQPCESVRLCTQRCGSMLRWCGWSIQAARRGPPGPSLP